MASAGTQWETVRKPGKKSKNQASNGLNKTEKKLLAEKMPRLDVAPPVKESPTIYDALKEKEVPPKSEKQTSNGTTQAKKPAHQPKKKPSEPKSKPKTMTEAVKEIDLGDMQAVLTKVQTTFPENPSVWLKDLASILNLKMDKVPERDPVFQDKPLDYPLSVLPDPIKNLLQETVNQCSPETLQHFLEHCIHSVVADMKQGVSTYGYRMFIQLLIHDNPSIIAPNINKYQELMRTNQNHALRCLSIMWAVGQAGVKRLDTGIKVWLQLMFNTLNIRSLSAYSVEYIEKLFQLHQDLKPAMNCLKVKDFFNIMDVVFTPQPTLQSNLQKKLQSLYPKLQTIAFGANPENHLKHFFPEFFNRSIASNKLLQQEAITGLVTCLSVDKGSFSEWRQMYTKQNLYKSGVLLSHMCKNWDSVSKVIDKKKLNETIRSFDVTNEDMAAKENMHNVEGYELCVTMCKELLDKMNHTSIPWRWLVMSVLSILSCVLIYDIYVHQGYKDSRTHKILSDLGILFCLEQINNKTKVYTTKSLVWLEENVPYYYARTCEFVGPYLQLFWERMFDFGLYIAEITKPTRTWLDKNIPLLLEKIQEKAPFVWDIICTYVAMAWDLLISCVVLLWQYFVHYLNIISTWLMENVFVGKLAPENILDTLSGMLASIQTYMIILIQRISSLLSKNDETPAMVHEHQ